MYKFCDSQNPARCILDERRTGAQRIVFLRIELGFAGKGIGTSTSSSVGPRANPYRALSVCQRLSGQAGISPIIRLHTQYGGGKTHGLIALVHAVRGMQRVENPGDFIDRALLPKGSVRIAALDGENSDPANGRSFKDGTKAFTLWGELAHELAGPAGYESVRVSDEKHIAPGAETLAKLFNGEPTLIMLDEISVYLRKAVGAHGNAAKQFTAFIGALIKAVETSPNAALVLTLAVGKDGKGGDAYQEENELALKIFEEAAAVNARKSTQLDPTHDDETAQVLRVRLFESVEPAGAAAAYDAYKQVWEKNPATLPVTFPSREEFLRTYPLHPHLLTLLMEKTSSLATFQRTRGMIRLLARTVHTLWTTKPADAFVIHTHHIDPGFDKIRDEITVRLGQGSYAPALKADIVEGEGNDPATAQALDAKICPGQLPLVSYVARTVFLHSLAYGDAVRGISSQQLHLSICSPLIEPAFIEQARVAFVAESVYLDDRPGVPLRFMTEPNLTMLIRREMSDVPLDKLSDKLSDQIRDSFTLPNGTFTLCKFPAGPYHVPDDTERPQLVVMDYASVTVRPDPERLPPEIEDIFEHKGSDSKYREFKNNLVFLAADEKLSGNLPDMMRKRMALESLKESTRPEITREHRKEISERLTKATFEAGVAILQCYRHLFYPAKTPMAGTQLPLAYRMIELANASEKPGNGQGQVVRVLEDEKKLVDARQSPPAPAYVRDSTPLQTKGEMSTRELAREFRRRPKFPILAEDGPILAALIRDGVTKGVFIYREGQNQITGPGDPLPAVHIDDNCFVATMEHAKAQNLWPRAEPLKVFLRANPDTALPGEKVELKVEVAGGVGPYTYNSNLVELQQSKPTTQNVLLAHVCVDSTKTFSIEVIDKLGNKQTGSVWVKVSKDEILKKPPQTTETLGIPVVATRPALPPLTAEGPLASALKELWDTARKSKVQRLRKLNITMHDANAVWKVHSAMIMEKTATVSCRFDLELSADGIENLTVNFTGGIVEAGNLRSFLEATLKQPSQKNFDALYTLSFPAGLALGGDDPEQLAKNLTKFGGTEAYVEAHAENEQEQVAA